VLPVLGIAPPSVRGSARTLADAGGCRPTGTRRVLATTVTDWTGCSDGGSVRLQVVDGVGHGWEPLGGTRRTARFLDQVLPGVG
ncbi:MAG: hypothetical protein M3P93_11995, partial [Actinomycetota bacterium]|nr:hypothetical protein [Actinomycetota bacterium]